MMRQADRLAFLGAVGAAGQHHLLHPRHADQPRQPHRGAAADVDAAACLPAARSRSISRRRGHALRRQARARRRPPRRAARRRPAPGRTRCAGTRGATTRECSTPSAVLRSVSSPRSRPAEKCSPSPWSTTALMSFGSAWKNAARPSTIVSLSALRFCGRFSVTMAMAPRRSAASEGGRLGREAAPVFRSLASGLLGHRRPEIRCHGQQYAKSCGVRPGRSSGHGLKAPRRPRSSPAGWRGRHSRWRGCG